MQDTPGASSMKRDTARLAGERFDILVIGAGIYGACAARDAALRGLKVALIDRGDFGAATSQNSLKIIHGGLRYLQQADVVRMRESIRERRTLMQIAPHFVHPLPCLMPTYGHFTKGREALAVAMLLNDLVGFDRNWIDDPQKRLPAGRILSRAEVLELLPGVAREGLTGGALWHDCQTHNSERLLLSFILSAADEGACAANYVEATGFIASGGRVLGARAADRLGGGEFDIRAGVVLNAAGPWTDVLLGRLGPVRPSLRLSSAMNLVTRPFISACAAGLSCRHETMAEDAIVGRGSRLFFVAPWRDAALAGTAHAPYGGDPDDFRVDGRDIDRLLGDINSAYPVARLTREDVRAVYAGLLPMRGVRRGSGEVTLLKHYRIIDHARRDGWENIVSIIGVKYTTARDVASRAVDLALLKLGRPFVGSRSAGVPVRGGMIERFQEFLDGAVRSRPPWIGAECMTHLVYHYGSSLGDILSLIGSDGSLAAPVPGQRYVTAAEVVHAVRHEMARTLADVVFRRTELGSAGCPGDECLRACAALAGAELGWDEARAEREIEAVRSLAAVPSP
ncbi:MAG: glycerol-3-phosphate dehydrogenase/oxidase [bacterium]|nr:glycerol-3-phosphate dehydrogenase/oxidase [bacterium]